MKKTILSLMAVSALVSVTACETMQRMSSPTDRAPGTYVSNSEHTDAKGTTVKTQQTTHVYKDSTGAKKAVVTTEKTTDPKGLMNKQTTTTTKSYN